jgi:hypothetical protein
MGLFCHSAETHECTRHRWKSGASAPRKRFAMAMTTGFSPGGAFATNNLIFSNLLLR